jgi:hypothetical protein
MPHKSLHVVRSKRPKSERFCADLSTDAAVSTADVLVDRGDRRAAQARR